MKLEQAGSNAQLGWPPARLPAALLGTATGRAAPTTRTLSRVPITFAAPQICPPSLLAAPLKAKRLGKLSTAFILSQLSQLPPCRTLACIHIANKSQSALPTLPSSYGSSSITHMKGSVPFSPASKKPSPLPHPFPKVFLHVGLLSLLRCKSISIAQEQGDACIKTW